MSDESKNTKTIETGNFNNMQDKGGWVVGNFIGRESLRCTSVNELKFAIHPQGYKKESGQNPEHNVRTLVILISGCLKLVFEDGQEVFLEKQGDYMIFETLHHSTEAIEDTVCIALRWPDEPVE